MCNLYSGCSIDASYQVSVHLVKQLKRRYFLIEQSETRIACGSHVCERIGTKCAICIEDLPLDAFYQVFFHLDKRFQRRFFLNRPIRNKKLPLAAMFVNGSGQHYQSL